MQHKAWSWSHTHWVQWNLGFEVRKINWLQTQTAPSDRTLHTELFYKQLRVGGNLVQ